jgi:peroxiredoxin
MKKLNIVLLLAFFSMPFMANAQAQEFILKGKVGNYNPPAKAYLLSQTVSGDTTIQDSVEIHNGTFTFKSTIPYPVETYLIISPGGQEFDNTSRNIKIYLEPGVISVTSPDIIANAKITGGQVNTDNEKIKILLKPIQNKLRELSQKYSAAPADEKKLIEKQKDSLDIPTREIYLNFIKAHPDHIMSIMVVKLYGGRMPKYNEVKPLFDGLNKNIRESALGVAYTAGLQKLNNLSVGEMAPDFTEADTANQPVSLHDFKGKYVFIDFWASWCHYCRQENPDIVAAYAKFKDKGLSILGVSLDAAPTKAAWLKAIQTDHLTWTQVSDLKSYDNQVAQLYLVKAIPQNFLIGPDGKIIAKDLHGNDLDKTLSEIFK